MKEILIKSKLFKKKAESDSSSFFKESRKICGKCGKIHKFGELFLLASVKCTMTCHICTHMQN